MEVLYIIILIIGFYTINKNIKNRFQSLEDTISALTSKIKLLQQKIGSQQFTSTKTNTETEASKVTSDHIITPETKTTNPTVSETKTESKITPLDFTLDKDIDLEKIASPINTIKKEPIKTESFSENNNVSEDTKATTSPKEDKKPEEPKKSWIETFKENNPDLEKFIGENLINKIGILILVLGISFFVKYAIDKDWINEPARVGIGILCGALVMAIAHKLKKNFASFSSVLVAGAISIFYFTIYIAFHEYGLFSQTVAFIIMVLITAFSALVSVSYNRQELAVLSLIGGFATPFMLSTGSSNYVVLFSYIAILNIGVLAISYFKKWKLTTILAFIFTILLFFSWIITKIWNDDFPSTGLFIFATIFYFIFSITTVLGNIRNKGVFSFIEYGILIVNTFFYFGIGLTILKDCDSNFTGLFTLALAIYNVVFASVLYKKFGLDKNAIYVLIGLALTFVTLAIPIQFEGNQITLFWAAEVVLLFWLSLKTKISAFKIGAVIIQGLTLISLFMDWTRYSSYTESFSVVLNPLFIAGLVVIASFFLTYWLLRNETKITTKYFSFNGKTYTSIVLVAGVIITYFTGILEVSHQAFQYITNSASATSFSVLYHFIFVAALLFICFKFKQQLLSKAVLIVSCISIVLYLIVFHKLPTDELTNNLVNTTDYNYAFYFHYIILACLIYFGIVLFRETKNSFNINTKQNKWLPWVFVFAIVFVLSNEVMVHGLQFSNSVVDNSELAINYPEVGKKLFLKRNFVQNNINDVQTQIVKIGYPILWGIFAFIFLIIGIKKQWKNLRIIALSLLGITIVKLFIYDIKNVSETGKIIAFILLGILILVISFVYQKIKKLVTDEDETIIDEQDEVIKTEQDENL
jgi:uncharacterized membrane protein